METDEEMNEYLSWLAEFENENDSLAEQAEEDDLFFAYANQDQRDRDIEMESFIKDHVNDAYEELDADFERWYTDVAMESKNNLEAINPDEIFVQCPYPSSAFVDVPLGMFHCPMCGEMVLAGLPHPKKIIAISQKKYDEFVKNLDKNK